MTRSQSADTGAVRRPTLRPASRMPAAPQAEEFTACAHCRGTGRAPLVETPEAAPVVPVLAEVPPVVTAAERVAVARTFNALCEALDGRRPATQLRAAAPVLRYVRASRSAMPRTAGTTRVLSLRMSRPRRSAIEAVAVVRLNGRPRAIAGRLDNPGGRWTLTALRIL